MRRMLILVAAVALLATACKIEINAEFTINADRSGVVVFEFGYDDEVAELAEANGESPDSLLSDFDIEDMPGAEVTTERRGDMTFQVVTVPVEDFNEAAGLGGDVAEGLTDDFQITFTDELVTVRGSTTLDDALGDDGDTAAFPPEMLADFFSVNIRITMPGKVLDHNATSASGNTLTWELDLTSGSLDVFAESDPRASSSSSSILLYVAIAAGVVLVLLLAWMMMRKRGGSSGGAPPPFEAAAPPAPPPVE